MNKISLSDNQVEIMKSVLVNNSANLKDFALDGNILSFPNVSAENKKAIIKGVKFCRQQIIDGVEAAKKAGKPKDFPQRKINGNASSANDIMKKFAETGNDIGFKLGEVKVTFKFK